MVVGIIKLKFPPGDPDPLVTVPLYVSSLFSSSVLPPFLSLHSHLALERTQGMIRKVILLFLASASVRPYGHIVYATRHTSTIYTNGLNSWWRKIVL